MIPKLRRRHFLIWLTLAVALPVLFVLSWNAIPKQSLNISSTALSNSTSSKPWAEAALSHHGPNSFIELKINQPLEIPGALVYLAQDSNSVLSESLLLGRIENPGTYKYKIGTEMSIGNYLLFYDPFHSKVTHSIEL